MKLSQEAKDKAAELKKLIYSQPPEVLYALMDFCSFDDEGMFAQGIEDAEEACEHNWATYQRFNNNTLHMGMMLPDIKVNMWGSEEDYDMADWEFSADQKAEYEGIKREKELDV